MSRRLILVAIAVLVAIPASAQKAEPIRRGLLSTMYGTEPFNQCNWMVVTGPEAAKQRILDQAKKAYTEADPERLAGIENKVFVEMLTSAKLQQGCSNRTMKEVVFVDKKTDTPRLRLPLESRESVWSNAFGATWNSDDGVAVADLAEFKTTLAKGTFRVIVVYADGGTKEISHGAGRSAWSEDETKKVRWP